jgi:hypothetical protein
VWSGCCSTRRQGSAPFQRRSVCAKALLVFSHRAVACISGQTAVCLLAHLARKRRCNEWCGKRIRFASSSTNFTAAAPRRTRRSAVAETRWCKTPRLHLIGPAHRRTGRAPSPHEQHIERDLRSRAARNADPCVDDPILNSGLCGVDTCNHDSAFGGARNRPMWTDTGVNGLRDQLRRRIALCLGELKATSCNKLMPDVESVGAVH